PDSPAFRLPWWRAPTHFSSAGSARPTPPSASWRSTWPGTCSWPLSAVEREPRRLDEPVRRCLRRASAGQRAEPTCRPFAEGRDERSREAARVAVPDGAHEVRVGSTSLAASAAVSERDPTTEDPAVD